MNSHLEHAIQRPTAVAATGGKGAAWVSVNAHTLSPAPALSGERDQTATLFGAVQSGRNTSAQTWPLHPRTQRPIDPDRAPLDVATLARLLNRSRWWVGPIAKQPDTPFSGKYSTLNRVTNWIFAHPAYKPAEYYAQRRELGAQESAFAKRLNQIARRSKTRSKQA